MKPLISASLPSSSTMKHSLEGSSTLPPLRTT